VTAERYHARPSKGSAVSRTPARHQKPRSRSARRGAHARHRQQSPIGSALAHKPTRIAAAVAGSTLVVSAAVAPALIHWARSAPNTAALDQVGGAPEPLTTTSAGQADAGRTRPARPPVQASSRAHAGVQRTQAPGRPLGRHHRRHHTQPQVAAAPVYNNPLRGISGLIPERVDMGVDFGGSGPIYAIGDGVITNATDTNGGWPGGGWITYRLTDGPAAGLMVYVAEDVRPNVQVGQTVTSNTAIATMFIGGAGIETGWAMPDGSSAESQLGEAGGISGGGPFPTEVGLNFEALLRTLGVPASLYMSGSPSGILPSRYPTNWTAATKPR
jgi:murein DD-endopeptidase MepM/ murein hydrolase activator NlpD